MITKTVSDLEKILPHRQTALMIDKVLYDPRDPNIITAHKHIDPNDPWLSGHFPEKPIYPGHCLIELVCLTAAALVKRFFYEIEGLPVVARIGEISFREPAFPNDNLIIQVELLYEVKGIFFTFNGKIIKNGKIICEVKNLKGVANKINKEEK